MTPTTSQILADLPVAALTQEARRNIARYLTDCWPNEDPYAFELFRRAIVQYDQGAWAALYDLYHALVRNWIANRLAGDVHADVCEALVNDAFVKFFRAIDTIRFSWFPSAPGLLAYFKTCARAALPPIISGRSGCARWKTWRQISTTKLSWLTLPRR